MRPRGQRANESSRSVIDALSCGSIMPDSFDPLVLRAVAGLLPRNVTTDQLLKAMIDRVVEDLDAERGTLFLLDARTGELFSRVAHLPELEEIRLPPKTGIAGQVADTGKPMRIDDAAESGHWFAGIDELTGFQTHSMLAAPIREPNGSVRGVLQLLNKHGGAFDDADEKRLSKLAEQVAEALARTSMRPATSRDQGLLVDGPFNHIVGDSAAMQTLYRHMLAAASTDATVLLRGESGTGKSLVARAIHDNSQRAAGPLIHLDCTTLPPGLIESELFGHERGAFTGAEKRVRGKCELADGGTLFLDEIGDLPLELQGKLLRFIQDRVMERVGGRETLHADVRLVTATNVDLEAHVENGKFRRDLYYRIRVVELQIPTLAQRGPRDIARLAAHFLDIFARRHRRPLTVFSPNALAVLQSHRWPGNVREVEHCIESAVVLCDRDQITEQHLSLPAGTLPASQTRRTGYPPDMSLADVERAHIEAVLEHTGGNRSEAARLLGVGRNTLLRKLRRS
jgi:DNA-binding NtrC family response regulator